MVNKYIIILTILMLSIPTVSANYSVGGGGWVMPTELLCHDWCYESKPYTTICIMGECVSNRLPRADFYSKLDGICVNEFEFGTDDYYECSEWWNNYYRNEINKNLDKIDRNIMIISGVLIILGIIILKKD